jgi:hypothetical protein
MGRSPQPALLLRGSGCRLWAPRYDGLVTYPRPRIPRSCAEAAEAFPKRLLLTKRASGTNGWMSSWGTNAHGEIAGCPPPRT